MNLINDIKKLVEDDVEHRVKIEVGGDGITVYLIYDPDENFEDNCIIPIYYSIFDEFSYIPDDRLREMFKPSDYGIDYDEIKLISKIMRYFEKHKQEINGTLVGLDLTERKIDELEKDLHHVAQLAEKVKSGFDTKGGEENV